ncbi:MAG: class I SAM-dependent methyltransferase [Ktedonobacterales bacterium]
MSKEHDLIAPAIPSPGGYWAELGSGTGIFTMELYQLVGPRAEIYSIDKNRTTLEKQKRTFQKYFPEARIHFMLADFTSRLDLPPLDGILMANSLHFVDFDLQRTLVAQISSYLKPKGIFLIVEYESHHGNLWVPHPIDYNSFDFLAGEAGMVDIHRLASIPSSFMGEMYSAMAVRPG